MMVTKFDMISKHARIQHAFCEFGFKVKLIHNLPINFTLIQLNS